MAYEMVGLIRMLIDRGGSDLHLAVDNPPVGRVHGRLVHFGDVVLEGDDTERLMKSIASVDNQQELQEVGGSDFGFAFEDVARFRVSIFKQKGNVGLVLRLIPMHISSMEELGLPASLKRIIDIPRGLILVTGPTGSGNPTTIPQQSYNNPATTLQQSYSNPTAILRRSSSNPPATLRQCYRTAVPPCYRGTAILRHSRGNPTAIPRQSHSNPTAILQQPRNNRGDDVRTGGRSLAACRPHALL